MQGVPQAIDSNIGRPKLLPADPKRHITREYDHAMISSGYCAKVTSTAPPSRSRAARPEATSAVPERPCDTTALPCARSSTLRRSRYPAPVLPNLIRPYNPDQQGSSAIETADLPSCRGCSWRQAAFRTDAEPGHGYEGKIRRVDAVRNRFHGLAQRALKNLSCQSEYVSTVIASMMCFNTSVSLSSTRSRQWGSIPATKCPLCKNFRKRGLRKSQPREQSIREHPNG